MAGKKRGKTVRKQRSLAKEAKFNSNTPSPQQTIIYSQPTAGLYVKQLQQDLRLVLEPNCAKNFVYNRKNCLKDVIAIANQFNVSHLMYFTHQRPSVCLKRDKKKEKLVNSEKIPNVDDDSASVDSAPSLNSVNSLASSSASTVTSLLSNTHVNMNLIRLPDGPRLTFRVIEYSLRRDIQKVVDSMLRFHAYNLHPPLLMVQGFGQTTKVSPAEWNALSSEDRETIKVRDRSLQLMSELFRSIVPNISLEEFKAEKLKRILLISREEDAANIGEDLIYLRHYRIVTQPKQLSRPVRKLLLSQTKGAGSGAGGSKNVPDLSHCRTMMDFVGSQFGPDSEISDLDPISDNEVEAGPDLPLPLSEEAFMKSKGSKKSFIKPSDALKTSKESSKEPKSENEFQAKSLAKHAVRLVELGPRITLKLLKIEAEVNGGAVLFHRYQHRTSLQVKEQERRAQAARERSRQLLKGKITEAKKRQRSEMAKSKTNKKRIRFSSDDTKPDVDIN